MSKASKSAVTELPLVTHGAFTIERDYPVGPEKVFFAFADNEMKRRWFVEGEGWEIYEYTPDFRVGGNDVYRFSFRSGPEIRNDAQYQDIQPNRRLVFSYRMAVGERPLSASLVTVEFLRSVGGTKMHYTEQGAYYDGADSAANREEGTRHLLDQLGKAFA